MSVLGLSLCVATALCWALSPLFLKYGLREADTREANALRSFSFLALAAGLAVLLSPADLRWHWGAATAFFLLANTLLGNVVGDVLYFVSLRDLGAGKAVAVSCAYPLFVAGISHLWFGEVLTTAILAGTGAIVTGLVLLRPRDEGEGTSPHRVRGFLFALLAALCWGMGIPITKWLVTRGGMTPLGSVYWRSLLLLLFVWAIWAWAARRERGFGPALSRLRRLSRRTWLSLLGAGATGLALGGFFFALALRYAPASLVTPITASSPLLTALFAHFRLKERTRPLQWVGIALIVIGSVAVGA